MHACYRHPGRETGRSCAICKRPVCLDCLSELGLGAVCPACKKLWDKPKTGLSRAVWKLRSLPSGPVLTLGLIVTNIAVFGAQLMQAGVSIWEPNPYFVDGAVSVSTIAAEPWRIGASAFVHLNFVHLLSNMLMLWYVGLAVEAVVPRVQYILVYGVALVGGSLGAILLQPDAATAGASGAIFGLTAAGAVVLRTRGGQVAQAYQGLLLGLLLVNLFYTFSKPDISVGGHLGGAAIGLLAGLIFSEAGPARRLSYIWSTLLVLGVGAAVLIVTIAVAP